jgi:hypothetical protein
LLQIVDGKLKNLGVMDKKNGILEMFRSSGQKEWCLFLTVTSTFITTYYFYNIK